jgi:hypothetical protein
VGLPNWSRGSWYQCGLDGIGRRNQGGVGVFGLDIGRINVVLFVGQ